MSLIGTELTTWDVSASVAIERKADSKCSLRAFQPVTNGLRAHSKIARACLANLVLH
jgi:hypothetical protein